MEEHAEGDTLPAEAATCQAIQQRYRISTSMVPIECPICHFTVHDGAASAFKDVCRHIMDQHGLTCTLSRLAGELKPGYPHAAADFR
jgi:hypothetical protein